MEWEVLDRALKLTTEELWMEMQRKTVKAWSMTPILPKMYIIAFLERHSLGQ